MKNLFETSTAKEIQTRIISLTPECQRQWGKMNISQMLAHCSAWMELAAGTTTSPRSFAGRIFGTIAKRSLLGEAPVRRNMPTDKQLIVVNAKDFAAEQQRLLHLVDSFASAGPENCPIHPHSFFGPMTATEWATLGYKHLDHHLKQFGA